MTIKPTVRIRLAYVADHAIEAWLALAAAITGVDFFVETPHYERTAIGTALHPWDYAWSGGYALAGLLVCFGLYRMHPRDEAAGLVLLGTAFAINLVATIAVAGTSALVAEVVIALLAAACFWRVRRLASL